MNSIPSELTQAVMPAAAQNILIWACAAVIAIMLVHALVILKREGDNRMLVLLGCGATGSFLEGFACNLINCWHSPVGIVEAYQAFGIHVPLWLAEVYVIFFGGMGYYFLRGFANSVSTVRLFWTFFIVVGASEGIFEMYTIGLGMFVYHGAQPLPIYGFPLYLGFINPANALWFSTVAALWFKFVKGGARYLLIVLTPMLLGGTYAALIYPTSAFLYDSQPGLTVAGSIGSMILSVALAALAYRVLSHLRDTRQLGS